MPEDFSPRVAKPWHLLTAEEWRQWYETSIIKRSAALRIPISQ